jgi:type IV secretory pathway VirB10-like protein
MNKSPWIIGGAVAVALIAVGTIYAMQAGYKTPDTAAESAFPADKGTAGSKGTATNDSRIVVPQGTAIAFTLETSLATKTASVGDRFQATVASPVHVGGRVAIPAGARVSGHVILAEQPGKASGRGQLQLSYDQMTFGGRSYDLDTRSQVYESKSGTKKDVALIGGGAVAGGIVGAVVGGDKSVAKGAAAGAVAGTGASLLTRGPQLTLTRGTVLNASLDQSVSVRRS